MKRRWEHFERAAELFGRYAMHACNSRLDTGVSFGVEKYQEGGRVGKSEEALCRGLVVYQAAGRMRDVEERTQAYVHQMERISGGLWEPGAGLREVAQSARGKAADTLTPAMPEETELIKQLSSLETRTAQLALARIQEREHLVEQRIAALELVLQDLVERAAAGPAPFPDREALLSGKEQHRVVPYKRPPHPAEERTRPLLPPLIEYTTPGGTVLISSQEGKMHLVPASPQWFDWLATLSSFRFVGQQGHFTAYRDYDRHGPTRSWSAHRRIHGSSRKCYLGTTDHLTIAGMEQAAATLQQKADSS